MSDSKRKKAGQTATFHSYLPGSAVEKGKAPKRIRIATGHDMSGLLYEFFVNIRFLHHIVSNTRE